MRDHRVLILWIALTGNMLGLRAEEPVAANEPPTVVVPYDAAMPVDGQTPGRVYLDYDTFQRLWKSAKERRDQTEAEAKAALGERAAAVSSAVHAARVEGTRLVVEARFTVLTRGPDWTAVPFPWQGAGTRSLTVDGAPAAVRDGNLIIEKPGLHSVAVEYEVPLTPGWTDVTWSVPPAAATSFALRLATDDPARPDINGMPVVESQEGEQRVFTAMLGTTDRITVRRHLSHARAGGNTGPPPLVTTQEHLFVTTALERLEAAATYAFPDQERREFSLRLDPGLTLVSMHIPGLRTWRLVEDGGETQLEFELANPARESLAIRWVAERPVAAVPASLQFPVFGATAGRIERQVVFLSGDDLEVRPHPEADWRQIGGVTLTEAELGGFSLVAAYTGSGRSPAPAYEVRPRAVERLATTSYVFQVSPGKFELIAGLQLKPAPLEALWEAVVRMPADLTVQGVAGDRLADWWREGDALHVRFSGPTPETTTVTLNLTRPLPPDTTTLAFTPLTIDGFDKVDGTGLIVAPLGWEAVIDFDQPATVVRETSPEAASRGFAVLPPFETKRGFAFDRADWTGTARLTAIPPKFEADWVLDTEVHEGFIALNGSLQMRIRQGALTTVSFTLPAAVPEVEVQGDDVREISSTVEGDVRRYTAVLQRETNSPLRFTLSGELPHAGQASLPDIDVPGATRIDRFLIVQNMSDGRLELSRTGLSECPPEEFAFLPEELAGSARPAQYFRAQPGWTGTVIVESLSTTSAQAAVVLEAELTTSLLRNGDEWMRAVYRLHNRSLQFLPVVLPAKAQLVSVVVAGRPSRADLGTVGGQPATLIPLIQTRPGDRSVEVAIVYRVPGPPPVNGVFERVLDDPDLPGLSVQQTLWSVQLPDGFSLRQAKGPMTRVTEASWDAEKWLGRLAESASLISLTSSRTSDATTRQEAIKNSSELLSEIQAAEAVSQSQSGDTSGYAQVVQELKKQQSQLTFNLAEAARQPATESPLEITGTQRFRYRKAFVENKETAEPGQAAEASATKAEASQLAINDNVLWENQTTTRATTTPQSQRRRSQIDKLVDRASAQSVSGKAVSFSSGEQASSEAKPGSGGALATSMPAEPDAQPQQQLAARALSQTFLNSRANAIAPLNQVAQSTPSAGNDKSLETPSDGVASTAAGTPGGATPPPSQQPASPPAPGQAGAQPTPPSPPRHSPSAGLTSHAAVADVFPSQSNTVYFKKIKDRATIDLTAAEPRFETRRLTSLGILLGAILVLFVADAVRAKNKRRKTTTPGLTPA